MNLILNVIAQSILLWAMFSLRRIFVKKVLVTIAAIAMLAFLIYLICGSNIKSTEDISYYLALSEETDGDAMQSILGQRGYVNCPYELPKLSELGPYEDYRFNYTAKRVSIFESHAYILIIGYNAETYEDQKAALEAKYTYCTEQSEGFSNGTMPGYAYEMDDFTIRAVEGGRYPHEMLFLGMSDLRQEIAIIFFYDQDLDDIEVPLGKFLDEETGWSEVAS